MKIKFPIRLSTLSGIGLNFKLFFLYNKDEISIIKKFFSRSIFERRSLTQAYSSQRAKKKMSENISERKLKFFNTLRNFE